YNRNAAGSHPITGNAVLQKPQAQVHTMFFRYKGNRFWHSERILPGEYDICVTGDSDQFFCRWHRICFIKIKSTIAPKPRAREEMPMGVEHRWSSRKEINMDVNLYYPPVGMINGKTRNVSLEGMYVDVEGVRIPPQARLEICFTADVRGKAVEHRLPAYVVHGNNGGIGLMLQHVGYREFDALRYMLNAA
ncbi:MAG: hypothetical protein ACE5FQ_14695, partial [Thiogranum sp.]